MKHSTNLTSKVISGKNAAELEGNINTFLVTLDPESTEIIKSKFGTTAAGLYFVVLYKNVVTCV